MLPRLSELIEKGRGPTPALGGSLNRGLIRFGPVLVAGCLLVAGAPASAQTPATIDSLRAEVARLQARLDSLQQLVATLNRGPAIPAADTAGDPIARIRAAAAAAAGAAPDTAGAGGPTGPVQFEGRQRNLNMLNPEISVTGDIFGFVNSEESDHDNFVPREFELALQSNLDPYSRAKIFVAHHTPGGEMLPFGEADGESGHGENSEVEIEEGYVEWVGLPGGLGLTLGKFRQRFGKLNRWHAHALPAQQLPLPYLAFLGEEGLAQTGVSLHWLVPVAGAGTYEVWGELTRSSNETVFGESGGPSGLAHVNGYWQLSPATYVELGVSGLTGDWESADGMGNRRIIGADFTFDWTPPERARYRQATLHGAWMSSRRALDGLDDQTANGAFLIGDLKLGQQWWVGARYEYVENPDVPEESAWLAGPTLTWWQSEFVRLRAEYAVLDGLGDRFGQFILQATFAMGPHKHETY